MRLFSGAVLGVALSTAVAHGAALFSFDETGGDVVGTLSGSLDLTGLSSGFDGTVPGGYIDPQLADLVSTAGPLDVYTGLIGPAAFGVGTATGASSTSGDVFGVQGAGGLLGVPDGYASGATLSATTTFGGTTFAGLGVTPGTYVYALPNDTLTVRFGPAPIPLPAGLPLLAGGLGMLALARRR